MLEVDETKLVEQLKRQARLEISQLFLGVGEDYASAFLAFNDILVIAEALGAEGIDEWESNGWQSDYFCTIQHEDKEYLIQASGFYGGVSLCVA